VPETLHDLYPRTCSFGENNWAVLAKFWHAVAWADDVTDQPHGVTLLDTAIVLFRDAGGAVVAAHDVCPHRGSLLSQGSVTGGKIICPYHGMQFAGDGRCTRVPSNEAGAKIPDRLHLRLINAQEYASLIWVCVDGAGHAPLPDWSALTAPGFQNYHLERMDAKTSAARFCENFNDVAHFAFVHRGTFGGGIEETIPGFDVTASAHGLHQELSLEQLDRTSLDGCPDAKTRAQYNYDFRFPFNNKMQIRFDAARHQHICTALSPVSATECRIFTQFARNYDTDQPIEASLAFERLVALEDLEVIEKVTPVDVPLDLTEEVSVAADKWSVAFRRAWKAYGLAQ